VLGPEARTLVVSGDMVADERGDIDGPGREIAHHDPVDAEIDLPYLTQWADAGP
jgi:hypothetical protein